jgi:hypothetical protein
MKCRCGNCAYANEHVDYSTTSIIRCQITGDIHYWNDECDCLDKNHAAEFGNKKDLFSIFRRIGVRRK